MNIPTITQDIPETKLAGKWAGSGEANVAALCELLVGTARKNDLKDTVADGLIGIGRKMGLSDESIREALFETYEGPVFYYP